MTFFGGRLLTEREHLFMSHLCFSASPYSCPVGSILRLVQKIPSTGIIQQFNVSDAFHFLLLLNLKSLEVWVFPSGIATSLKHKGSLTATSGYMSVHISLCV